MIISKTNEIEENSVTVKTASNANPVKYGMETSVNFYTFILPINLYLRLTIPTNG